MDKDVQKRTSPDSALALPRFEEFVVSLPGLPDAAIPVSAARAGATGLLDLSHLPRLAPAAAALDALLNSQTTQIGIVVDATFVDTARAAIVRLPAGATVVIGRGEGAAAELIALSRERGLRVGCVVCSAEEIVRAETLGAQFLIGKGHESGGVVGDLTAYVLLQTLQRRSTVPFVVWGGIGWRSALACRVGGASGIVLDWQLALMRESALPTTLKQRVSTMDGSETAVVKGPEDEWVRVYAQPGFSARDTLESLADQARRAGSWSGWRTGIADSLSAESPEARAWLMGQEACFAAEFAAHGASVGRVLPALRQHLDAALARCVALKTLEKGAPMAASQSTDYPVMQGAMTRVSDVPAFCDAVERGGAMPVLALALMHGADVRTLLDETKHVMGTRTWGVGMLGFVERNLRAEQLHVIEEVRPPYVVIAGGRPDQCVPLEAKGIKTYLHVPSPGMLDMFVKEGARRFILEGQECGGHIGPRSSFVLWDSMVRVLINAKLPKAEAERIHVYFAGGIHDASSAAMALAIAEPLAAHGMKFGLEMGTAYLFTHEAVSSGAILPRFQEVAREAAHTVLVETGPGHAIRCAPTDFYADFEAEKARLRQSGMIHDEIRNRLEMLNMGRLRIASKGIARAANPPPGHVAYEQVSEARQRQEGMYMIGQVAALHEGICSIRELHARVCDGGAEYLRRLAEAPTVTAVIPPELPAPPPLDIAIVGMGCILPGAEDPETFWDNIMQKRNLLSEVPPDRFDINRWFDPNPRARDKVYSRMGGFIRDLPFDPIKYGIPPASLASIEPAQLLALELVDRAMIDAGYGGITGDNPMKARTSVILGVGGGMSELGSQYSLRAFLPHLLEHIDESLWSQLPEWTEDSFAGLLLNIVAGRASNKFDLGGVNFTVDAACASSLAAIYLACRELADGTSDVAITGGVDTVQSPMGYMCFASARALTPNDKPRVFDAGADGIVISEGLGAVVLKRRADAERDGDRIYAVIRAAAGGSDGRSKSMTAPLKEGQLRTLTRAYNQARFSPATVELFEAHGTGTALGDKTESMSVVEMLQRSGAGRANSAIGSVKSMIGHTKCTAGVAGLMKAALALHYRTLPPTLHVTRPNPEAGLVDGPLYVNTENRPWVRGRDPRRAGVSAFGFGGTNFHAVLEEYEGAALPPSRRATPKRRPAELFTFGAATPESLASQLTELATQVGTAVQAGAAFDLADLAFTQFLQQRPKAECRAAIVATDAADLLGKLQALAPILAQRGEAAPALPAGIFYSARPKAPRASLAFVYPGQGSQYPHMQSSLALYFAEASDALSEADAALKQIPDRVLSRYIYPPPTFTPEAEKAASDAIKATEVAQPALGACSVAAWRVLNALGVRAAMHAGHSYGELVALHVAGAYNADTLFRLSRARGAAMAAIAGSTGTDLGTMVAVKADEKTVRDIVAGLEGVWLANANSPSQTVISGSRAGIAAATERFAAAKLAVVPIPVACAFHSPLVAPAQQAFGDALKLAKLQTPHTPVFSNTNAAAYPVDVHAIPETLLRQIVNPVRFVEEIEAMYAAGARVFVEVGPLNVLTRLIGQILHDRPHVTVATDARGVDAFQSLLLALATLFTEGIAIQFERLYQGRRVNRIELRQIVARHGTPLPAHVVLANGAYIRPASAPKRVCKPRATMAPSQPQPVIAAPPTVGVPSVAQPVSYPSAQPLPGPAAPMTAASAHLLVQWQETMRRFLETQQAVMNAYMGGGLPQLPATASVPRPMPNVAPIPATIPVLVTPPSAPFAPPADSRPAPPPTAPGLSIEALEQELVRLVSDRTGYPKDMLNLDAAMEGDLGIDSIKRVEILSVFAKGIPNLPADLPEKLNQARTLRDILKIMQQHVPAGAAVTTTASASALTSASPAPQVNTALSEDHLRGMLLDLVSQRTGYPKDMLNLDAAMEGDLGIDSIKRVEILSAFGKSIPNLPADLPEKLNQARTLRDILNTIQQQVPSAPMPAVASAKADRLPTPAPIASLDSLEQELVHLVSERTGYPKDMLNLDAAMEGDLGIDSIKRVEILSAFVKGIPNLAADLPEKLNQARTLREVLNTIQQQAPSAPMAPAEADRPPIPDPSKSSAAPSRTAVGRYLAKLKVAPLSESDKLNIPEGAIVITDDGRGVADVMRDTLASLGAKPVIIRQSHGGNGEGLVDLTQAAAVTALLQTIRQAHGGIGGIIHLLPLRDAPSIDELDDAAWKRALDEEVKGFFHLVRAAAPDLSQNGRRWVLAGVAMGGPLAAGQLPVPQRPWRGGVMGIVKTVSVEWPAVCAKCLDLDDTEPAHLAQQILEETQDTSTPEIYYREGHRLVTDPGEVPLNGHGPTLDISSHDVIMIIGGARGITGEVARVVAERWKPTIVLTGRSPWPDAESLVTQGAATDRDIKQRLFEDAGKHGRKLAPIELERETQRVLMNREMRETRHALEATGATVAYYPVDACDSAAMAKLFTTIQERFARLDGIICGAGLIEDKLIGDKTPESFARVLDLKTSAAFVLARLARPESLKFMMLFSSIAGWTGNRGQADYVAANDILNRMALYLTQRWGKRVVAMDWGPWEKTGMVTDLIRRQFEARGVWLVPAAAGGRFAADEIQYGGSTDALVLALGKTDEATK